MTQQLKLTTILLGLWLAIGAPGAHAADEPAEHKHRVMGLFCPERQADLKTMLEKLPQITLVSIDYQNAEATFRYDAKKTFGDNATPQQVIERFDNLLQSSSRGTFGIKPPLALPRDQLQLVEIPVVGLDCLACSFAAYNMVQRTPGVEQATASFKTGLVTAWIDPAKTNRAALEALLKERGVTLKQP